MFVAFLVSLAQNQQQSGSEEAVPREVHEEEMQRMRLEVQQGKDFIHTQQQLLQVGHASVCHLWRNHALPPDFRH